MPVMVIGTGIIQLHLPGVRSLKEKRSILKSLTSRLHREFNVSCSEVNFHDVWQSAEIGIAVVSTTAVHAENVIENVLLWIETNRPDVSIIDHRVEIIH